MSGHCSRYDYRDEFLFCEICTSLLGKELPESLFADSIDVHHIWPRVGRHYDVRSNLICLCRGHHLLGHNAAWAPLVRLACLAIKWSKNELDAREIDRAAGAVVHDARPVAAWIERHAPFFDTAPWNAWAELLIKHLE